MRWARSPVAPKMTSVVGWTGQPLEALDERVLLRGSLRSTVGPLVCDRVAAELVAQRGEHLVR